MKGARIVRGLWWAAVLGAVVLAPLRAHAEGGDGAAGSSEARERTQTRDAAADAARITAAGHSLKWNWTPPGRTDRYGHAETLIHAPLQRVRSRVLDYGHYKDFMPDKFKSSRVVGHGPDGSADVYVQIAVLHGMVTLWDVTRFEPAKTPQPGVDVIEGRMVPGKGNVEDLSVVWTLHTLDPEWTVLKLDLLLKPGLPAPQWAIDEELRDSAMCAVDAIHDRAQGSQSFVPWAGP